MGILGDLIPQLLPRPRLGEVSALAARRHGDGVAFRLLPSQTAAASIPLSLTFREFDQLVEFLACELRKNLNAQTDDARPRVIVRGGSGTLFFASVLAVSRAGAIAVPVNPELTESELAHVIDDSGARLEIAPESIGRLDSVDRVIARWCLAENGARRWPMQSMDDVAAIFYTSGTTGKPKGAMLTHAGLLSDMAIASVYPFRNDLLVEALPTAHIMGFLVLAGALLAGIQTLALERFRPVTVLDAIESFKATMFVGVPAMYRMMLDAGARTRNLKSVRVWMSAADVMPKDLASAFQGLGSALTIAGHPIGEALFVEAYGMVEYSGAATVKISPPYWNPLSNSLGIPIPGTEIRIVDEEGSEVRRGEVGEIAIKGGKVLHSYRNRSDETERVVQSGWLRTGDLARRGFVFDRFAGRSKDVVTSGGYTVYAVEVEERLRALEAVADAAVVGIPDPVLGERVVAALEPEPGADLELATIAKRVQDDLAEYKCPASYLIVESLPRGSTRKVKKDEVRRLFEANSVG